MRCKTKRIVPTFNSHKAQRVTSSAAQLMRREASPLNPNYWSVANQDKEERRAFMAEPVRGIKRRDRQGGRRSWWSKAELPGAQKKELEEAMAAASSEREEDDSPSARDAAPTQPQRRGNRRSWWSKEEKLPAAELQELEQAAADSSEKAEEGPKPTRPGVRRRDRDGGGRRSWWSSKDGMPQAVRKELEDADASGSCEDSGDAPVSPFKLRPLVRRVTKREARASSPKRPAVQRKDGNGGARRSWWGRKENLPMKELEALAAEDKDSESSA